MNLTHALMLTALDHLDKRLESPVRLIVGGGAALLLAHGFSLSTQDIDAVPAAGATLEELASHIESVAHELGLPSDWLNPFYSTFAHVLPADYGTRLIDVGSFRWLKVLALSKPDLLIMKCFAARQKDVVHARALYKGGASIMIVKAQIELLKKKRTPGCERAEKFLGEIETFFEDKDE